MRAWSISTGHTVERDRSHAFFYILILYYSVTIKLEKYVIPGCHNLFVGSSNKAFRIGISKCLSSNDFMLGQNLTILENQ